MKNRLFLIFIFIILTMKCFCQIQNNLTDTIFLKVYDDYSNCGIKYTVKMECIDVNFADIDTILSINEENEIKFVVTRLNNLKAIENLYEPDVRMKLWLNMKGVESTFCFGTKNEPLVYNGQLFEYDKSLINFFLMKLDKVEFDYTFLKPSR